MELNTQDNGLLRIDFQTGKLYTPDRTKEINGVTVAIPARVYTVHNFLSVERYCEFQIFEKELAYASTFKTTFDKIKKALAQMNAMKMVDAIITLTDLVRGMVKVEEREPTVLKICALFINYEGEDIHSYSKDVEADKINDWKGAGVDMRDFFTVALHTVPGFLEIYAKISQSITEALKPDQKEAV